MKNYLQTAESSIKTKQKQQYGLAHPWGCDGRESVLDNELYGIAICAMCVATERQKLIETESQINGFHRLEYSHQHIDK